MLIECKNNRIQWHSVTSHWWRHSTELAPVISTVLNSDVTCLYIHVHPGRNHWIGRRLLLSHVLTFHYIPHCYYAALLPRRGPHIASHSVRLSVCLSVRPSRYCFCLFYSRTVLRANIQNRKNFCFRLWASVTYVLFGTHRGPHIVRPSRPHKFLF